MNIINNIFNYSKLVNFNFIPENPAFSLNLDYRILVAILRLGLYLLNQNKCRLGLLKNYENIFF